MRTQQRLIADVNPGDTLVFRDEVYGVRTVLVTRIEWDSRMPWAKINGEMVIHKTEWVEVVA